MDSTNTQNGMVMPVGPLGGYAGYGGGFGGGMFDGNGLVWLIVLFLIFGGNGWGGNGYGNANGIGSLPYFFNNTDNAVRSGFDNAAVAGQLNGIQNAVTSGFANAEIANCGRAADAMQTAYNNQIASMNQNFANQQAISNQMNGFSMALQNCCCENRAAVADLKYNVATEACADRNAVQNALRDVLTAQAAGIQSIKDQMCQDKMDAQRDEIANLRNQVNMQNLAASQSEQTARLIADNTAQTQALLNRLGYFNGGCGFNGCCGNGMAA